MAQYSRMFLHFMHAMTNNGDRVHSFSFGTRLTNISRYLRNKDVDLAPKKPRKRWKTGQEVPGSASVLSNSTGTGPVGCWVREQWSYC